MAKKSKQKKEFFLLKYKNIVLILGVFFLLAVYIFPDLYTLYKNRYSVIESPRTEMKKLPKAIQKKLSHQSQTVSIRVPILMYHYVEYVKDTRDTIRKSLNIVPSVFEEQIKTLKNDGYTFMTARELANVISAVSTLPKKPILITIDDGHWDVDTDILPILKKYNIKATMYVIPGFTGGSDFMTKAQVEDVIKSELVEVGAHTVHHVSLKGKPLAIIESEVKESKKMLEDTYHINVSSFAYPNGAFDEASIKVVKDAGFTSSASTIPGIMQSDQNRFFLYRLRPGRRVGQELLDYLSQNVFTHPY